MRRNLRNSPSRQSNVSYLEWNPLNSNYIKKYFFKFSRDSRFVAYSVIMGNFHIWEVNEKEVRFSKIKDNYLKNKRKF